MATIVLTAVGTALGGPIGGAIGALAGQAIDARLFAPRPRHGPRLGELAVQTSSYGTAIPKVFGTMRVAGSVIWSTDLQERRASEGGGKGRPKTVQYSYSASFAVALSGRPIRAVRRIWADGKLLRGAAGDFKSETKFRLHPGDEDQAADPLIVSAEGAGGTPAFRGIAYAMFEEFQLADYANHIPSLTFEVEADEGVVAIGAIAEVLSSGIVGAGATPSLAGYAASGDSVRGVLEDLADVFPLGLDEEDGGLRIRSGAGDPALILAADLGAYIRDPARGRTERMRGRDEAGEVTIAYHDASRDYQTGMQRVAGVGAQRRGLSGERIALPAVLTASAAKSLAEERLLRIEAARSVATAHLPVRHASIRAGSLVQLAGIGGVWRVVRWSLEAMVVRLELVRFASGAATPVTASPGRPVTQPDLEIGPTTLQLLDVPLYGERAAERPQLVLAAAGAKPGWRSAVLSVSYDRGASWQPAGATAAPATIGAALTPLPGAGAALFDDRNHLEIELLNDGMSLESRDDAALVGGANLASLGDELLQFGRAEQIGDRVYRLSRLLRGRFGTEWAAGTHQAGDCFLWVEAGSIVTLEPPLAMLGGEVRVLASGLGDGVEGVAVSGTIQGEVIRPPSPAHLSARRAGDGTLNVNWVRRSRSGWRWLDGADAPLGEEAERYRVVVSDGQGRGRTAELAVPVFSYTAAMQASDGLAGPITIEVVQLGTQAPSRAAMLIAD